MLSLPRLLHGAGMTVRPFSASRILLVANTHAEVDKLRRWALFLWNTPVNRCSTQGSRLVVFVSKFNGLRGFSGQGPSTPTNPFSLTKTTT